MLHHTDIVVVAAGDGPDVSRVLPAGAAVIAADGGLERARALGLEVDAVVGDLDSAPADTVEDAARAGAAIHRHPAAKDASDLELALAAAAEREPRRVVVVASDGGRLDHVACVLQVLGTPALAGAHVDAHVGRALVHVVRYERRFAGKPGELVSLLAVHGRAEGVRTEGLVYPLAREPLEPGSSRGLSNVLAAHEACVTVERGTLLAIRPDPVGAMT